MGLIVPPTVNMMGGLDFEINDEISPMSRHCLSTREKISRAIIARDSTLPLNETSGLNFRRSLRNIKPALKEGAQ
jgi:hypothetical protein